MKPYRKFLCLVLLCLLLAGCTAQTKPAGNNQAENAKKPVIVTTVFPVYDWTRELLGEDSGAELVMLLDSGVDLHSFQPTADDIMKIATCDLFICIGGESDEWVEDALKEAVNPDMIAIRLLDALGEDAKEEEAVEGMQEDHEHDHDHEDEDEDEEHHGDEDHEDEDHGDEDHDHDAEYDEHIWLSLRNASTLTGVIADALLQLDLKNPDAISQNLAAYREALSRLDAAYGEAVNASDRDTLVFCDRFPFRYLTDDYGLHYYAAFAGCSAETEASFETISFLSEKTVELNLSCVIMVEGGDGKIAETVLRNAPGADRSVVVMDSMQGVTAKDVSEGASYLTIMEKNLEALKQALQ